MQRGVLIVSWFLKTTTHKTKFARASQHPDFIRIKLHTQQDDIDYMMQFKNSRGQKNGFSIFFLKIIENLFLLHTTCMFGYT